MDSPAELEATIEELYILAAKDATCNAMLSWPNYIMTLGRFSICPAYLWTCPVCTEPIFAQPNTLRQVGGGGREGAHGAYCLYNQHRSIQYVCL
jgi:hypothetical protein